MPVLKVKSTNASAEVYLQSLDIQVEVTGNIASTRYTMVFKNRTGKILEGELTFPLPDGITVSHYALDINGKMRDAVPVEKAKAVQVFEEIEQRRVDPGLLERVEGNNFRTRIYPIPANGTRTVSITYEEELSAENALFRYHLPMAYPEAIEKLTVKCIVWKSKTKPQVLAKPADEFVFDEIGENFVASFTRNNYKPDVALIFALPAPDDIPQVLMQSASGSYYFLASCAPAAETRKKQWGSSIGIIWDVSLSGLQRNTEKELEVLDLIFKEKKNLSVSLYLLNNRIAKKGVYSIKNGNWADLKKTLESLVYDGGTNFSAVKLKNIVCDEILFFSDGLSSLSEADFVPKANKTPVHCIVSSAKADYSAMRWIAAQTKGKYINLNALSNESLQKEVSFEGLYFLGIEKNNSVRETYPSVSVPIQNNFSIAGILEGTEADLTFLFGYGDKVEKRVTVTLNAKDALQKGNVYRIWAQKKISELDMCYERNSNELTELGQQFGIVTRNTSLIVLESLQDYLQYNIIPPVELREEFFRLKKESQDRVRQDEQTLLNNAVAQAEVLQNWWKKDFVVQKPKYPKPDDMSLRSVPEDASVRDESDMEMQSMRIRENAADTRKVSLQDVRIRGYGTMKEQQIVGGVNKNQAIIRRVPIKQDNEYSKLLTGVLEKDYAAYLKIRPDYMNTPTFYFDMADWFFSHNNREKALLILTSIAELDLENASLYRLLGYRLKEYEEYALEAYICKKVILWRPTEKQSYRDYALALADNAQYQTALDSLYSALTHSYSLGMNTQQDISEVLITEINRLIAKNSKLDCSAIDKRIIMAMPVDIRVVINWNMNNTDIDLHIKDPDGEECYYGHKETLSGGHISRDITRGYGPEQFILKKAIKGKYGVFVNYFSDTKVKDEGPATVMVEIFTKYSDNTEQRQVACFQMSKEKKSDNGLIKIAEFEFFK